MTGISEMTKRIKSAMNKRIENESQAMRGTITNNRFYSGNKSYSIKQAVECNTNNGHRCWALRSKNGNAVIVGA